MRIGDWSSDVCSSDLGSRRAKAEPVISRTAGVGALDDPQPAIVAQTLIHHFHALHLVGGQRRKVYVHQRARRPRRADQPLQHPLAPGGGGVERHAVAHRLSGMDLAERNGRDRSEEHTSELQSLMRISYAVFCLKKKILFYSLTS